MIKNLCTAITNNLIKNCNRVSFSEYTRIPKVYNPHFSKEDKKKLAKNKPFGKLGIKGGDCLTMPGYDLRKFMEIQNEFLANKVELSPHFLALMFYNLTKLKILTKSAFAKM
jgi:hypothetical protein